MRLVCPSCGSSYEVPEDWGDAVAQAGNRPAKVRCRTCRTVFEVAPALVAVPEAIPSAGPETMDAPPARARRWRRSAGVVAGGLVIGVAFGAISALLAIPGAPQRVAADPRLPEPVATALAQLPGRGLLILQPAGGPLRVEAVAVRRPVAAGGFAFEVTGEIRNPGSQPQRAPMIELRLMGADGATLERRTIPSGDAQVLPGGGLAFSTVALNVPEGATRLAVALRPALPGTF